MGITNLLNQIGRPKSVSLSSLRGKSFVIDGHCFIHKCCTIHPEKVVLENDLTHVYSYLKSLVQGFMGLASFVTLVFDGGSMPSKAGTDGSRRARREESLREAIRLKEEGRTGEAYKHFMGAFSLKPFQVASLARQLFLDFGSTTQGKDAAKSVGRAPRRGPGRGHGTFAVLIAPHEADAQIAFLQRIGLADYIVTNDSDILLYNPERVLFRYDPSNQTADLIENSNIYRGMFSPEAWEALRGGPSASSPSPRKRDEYVIQEASSSQGGVARDSRGSQGPRASWGSHDAVGVSPASPLTGMVSSLHFPSSLGLEGNLTGVYDSLLPGGPVGSGKPRSFQETTDPLSILVNGIPLRCIEDFKRICILSGCDYLDSLQGVGLAKAKTSLLRHGSMVSTVLSLSTVGFNPAKPKPLPLPASVETMDEYIQRLTQAWLTFSYHVVFNPITMRAETYTPLLQQDKALLEFLDPLFFGGVFSDLAAALIACGYLHPTPLELRGANTLLDVAGRPEGQGNTFRDQLVNSQSPINDDTGKDLPVLLYRRFGGEFDDHCLREHYPQLPIRSNAEMRTLKAQGSRIFLNVNEEGEVPALQGLCDLRAFAAHARESEPMNYPRRSFCEVEELDPRHMEYGQLKPLQGPEAASSPIILSGEKIPVIPSYDIRSPESRLSPEYLRDQCFSRARDCGLGKTEYLVVSEMPADLAGWVSSMFPGTRLEAELAGQPFVAETPVEPQQQSPSLQFSTSTTQSTVESIASRTREDMAEINDNLRGTDQISRKASLEEAIDISDGSVDDDNGSPPLCLADWAGNGKPENRSLSTSEASTRLKL